MEQSTQIVEVEKKEEQPKKPRKILTAMNASFEIANGTVSIFKELFKTVKEAISDEIPFEIHQDKLVLRKMDASRIMMCDFVLNKEIFEEWHVWNGTKYKPAELPIRIVVPLGEVIYAIEDAGKDARVKFEVTTIFSAVKRPIRVKVYKPAKCPKCGLATTNNQLPRDKRGKKGNRYKCQCGWRGKVRVWERTEKVTETEMLEESKIIITVSERTKDKFTVKIFEQSSEDIPLPIIDFDGKFKLVAKDFKGKLEKAAKKTDHIKIVGSEKELALLGDSDYVGIDMRMNKGSDILLVAEAYGEQKAVYPLKELINIMPKPTKPSVAEIVGIEYTTDRPMRVTWFTNLGTSTITFYLAPRIETE
jgi:predicted RNA-binding Zn-ribbon protein involved in translation (DUF1610 family)